MSLTQNDLLSVSWTFLKAQFATKPFRMAYTQQGTAYQVYIVSQNLIMGSLLIDPAEVSDFTANYQANATAVTNVDEAIALALLPEVSQAVLSTQNSGRSFGYAGTSAVATITVRASAYTPPGNNAQRSVRSTSNSDGAGPNTGARKVKITYLDADGNGPFEEIVTLSGTTGVNTVATNIALVEKMEVVEVGSNGGNIGTIELKTGLNGGGSNIGTINVGDNRTYWAHHYVPKGRRASIMAVDGAASVAAGGLTLNAIPLANPNAPQQALDVTMRHGTVFTSKSYQVPVPVDGPAIVFLNERPDVSTASTIFAGFAWIQY